MLEEIVEEKESTSFRTKPLLVIKKSAKKKRKKNRKKEKEKEEIEKEKDEEEKTKENDHNKSVPTSVPEKKKVIYLFSKISASNNFTVFGNLHQIEWDETMLMIDNT